MRLRSEQLEIELSKALKPVYLVFGDTPLLVQEATASIRAAARAQGYSEREYLTVETGFDWNILLQTSASLSLFSQRRLVELRLDVKPSETGAKALQSYAKQPPDDVILLISCDKLDKSAQQSRWFKALEMIGAVIQIWPVGAHQLPAWIRQRMAQRGLRPSADAVTLLAERVEGNLLAAAQEIDKLYLLFGSAAISAEQLLSVVSNSARYSIYDLVDAALAGDTERVIRIIKGLHGEGVDAVLVSWALHREISLLTGIRFAVQNGLPTATALAQSNVWEKRKPLLSKALSRLSLKNCRSLLRACAQLDRIIKGAEAGDPWQEVINLSLRLAGHGLLVATTR